MEPVKLLTGYLLPEGKDMQDILRLDAELLAQEGIDPAWAEAKSPPSDKDSDEE